MSPHSYTLSRFRANQPLLLLLKAACCREAANTNCIVFGLTRSGIEPTTCNTQGDHTNHYTSDVVICDCYVKPCEQFFQLYQGKNKIHSDTTSRRILLDQYAQLDFSMKQQYAGIDVIPHIILILTISP